MLLFETSAIYGIEHASVYVRPGCVEPSSPTALQTIEQAEYPLLVQGIKANDFGIFACLIDYAGASEVPYLVTDYGYPESLIVPSAMVENNPQQYGTFELARKLRSVNIEEIYQFGIEALVKQLSLRYPFNK